MRKLFILLIIAASLPACKGGRELTPSGYTSPPIRPVATEVVEKQPEPPKAPEPVKREPPAPVIPVVEERFEFEKKQDELNQQVNRFFVILGSFRVSENASNYRSRLEKEGFTPTILLSETGFHRVSINSYSQEAEARQRVLQIRRTNPQYHDAWLLIRKQ
jgi:cell division protein FtsN